MATAADRLAAVRHGYRHRKDARRIADLGFASYAVGIIVLVVGIPLIRAIIILLTEPPVLSLLQSPASSSAVSVVVGLILAGFASLGQLRGPVSLSPFFVTLLASTDLARSRTLLRPFTISTSIVVTVFMAFGVLVSCVLVSAGAASPLDAVGFVIGCASVAFIACAVWLAGQRTSRRPWILPSSIIGATLLTVVIEPLRVILPWGWDGILWPGTSASGTWAALLLVLAAAASLFWVPRLLNLLDSSALLEQATRWRSAGISAMSGDFAAALGGFRARPALGRSWTAVTGSNVLTRFLLRDLIGTLRTPGRFVIGTLVLIVACSVCHLGSAVAGIPSWLLAGIGSAAGYLALGVFSDGFRHAAEATGKPALYGYGTSLLYSLHAVLPATFALVAVIAGAAALFLLNVPPGHPSAVLAVAVVLVILRAYDSAKGPLPPILMTPIPSSAGDLSGLVILAWQTDALLSATIAGAAIVSLTTSGNLFSAFATAMGVVAGLLFLLRRRLRRL
ncbi:hypothetical protein LWF01_05730 [Saxibacter everestensis]|uniref:ABC transporter permease n=1 Tax=Saxibacter everestensis TaxID=2909229 RepID=A0ABY8QWA5_9MICO|nr:hypothetical protein LWF01_05730 [Brevibacteriaceae bacterium ZFBP1038]